MMDDRQNLALKALALMVKQYLEERPDGLVDNHAMSAGERAFEALAAFGYMEMSEFGARFARWSDAGHFCFGTIWHHPLPKPSRRHHGFHSGGLPPRRRCGPVASYPSTVTSTAPQSARSTLPMA